MCDPFHPVAFLLPNDIHKRKRCARHIGPNVDQTEQKPSNNLSVIVIWISRKSGAFIRFTKLNSTFLHVIWFWQMCLLLFLLYGCVGGNVRKAARTPPDYQSSATTTHVPTKLIVSEGGKRRISLPPCCSNQVLFFPIVGWYCLAGLVITLSTREVEAGESGASFHSVFMLLVMKQLLQ